MINFSLYDNNSIIFLTYLCEDSILVAILAKRLNHTIVSQRANGSYTLPHYIAFQILERNFLYLFYLNIGKIEKALVFQLYIPIKYFVTKHLTRHITLQFKISKGSSIRF